jgi:2-polyprenyl-6-methoxyphenol hydroxylase-like FAD-dependent oxidoreductase
VLVGVAVLERRGEESNLSRALAVHARTLEVMDMRGLAEEFTSEGAHVPELRLFGRDRVDLSGLPTRFPYLPGHAAVDDRAAASALGGGGGGGYPRWRRGDRRAPRPRRRVRLCPLVGG